MKVVFFLFLPLFAIAQTPDLASQNAHIFGIFTLLPPIVAIALAFISKDVVLSLFLGAFTGTFMLALVQNGLSSEATLLNAQLANQTSLNSAEVGFWAMLYHSTIGAFTGLVFKLLNSMASAGNAGIILQVLTIGGVVALITKSGGTKAVALWLSQKAKQAKSSQFATWCMGCFVFFDDYANSLIVGPIMRPVTDKFKVSREKLAFIMDATAAPITGLAIISTWIGLEVSLIRSGYDLIDSAEIFTALGVDRASLNAFEIFVQTLPYRFYNLFMLVFVLLTIFMGREFGPMLKAELNARAGKFSHGHEQIDNIEDKLLEPKEHIALKTSNSLIPLFILVIFAFVGFYFSGYNAIEDEALKAQINASPLSLFALRETFGAADASVVLFQAALLASIVAIIMGIWRKIWTLKEGIATWTHGWRTMIMTVIILLCAWSLASTIKDLGTSKYLIELLSSTTPLFVLASAVFLLASIISFSTGTSYGTMGILMPLTIPLAAAVGFHNDLSGAELHHYMVINISAVLTGAIFGDHCSPISDTTILSSMGSRCELLAHVKTQMPYALSVCVISILCGYLPVSFGLNVWLSLILGLVVMILLLRFIGKKV
ncbi:Na+/H+ antiporter NhaC family protein [Campylobacter sp. MIT 97-5078]|uniref:Na+/H+ antiporter NhaC family protein n=1 Tax=Campylobacter sp. MIT 97-5078 TaxID=1548153 RepID=UPI0005139171|nr:Na+/H+ antiporter NhaC family protein [Campylobacter sp. MIT 97-5078]KGI55979.1 sodium:proton antiporter [Campylobacter sp. MIT 97-5078]KGI57441.1 sodium:proton antiporter [Campylobacter sp. MIT 97-5078]KGI57531.1 sodium:proton antiporter [Campylobacter sp. MIT 97-5078]TQR27365.1 sodium:proton antiporter [Campylobacter sp. MIT 97-5078]